MGTSMIFRTAIAGIVFCLAGVPAVYAYSQEDLREVQRENEREQRLVEYKDNKTTLKLKLEVLDTINENRRRHGLNPLKLDILACRVASKASSEAVKGGYFGHWNLRGEKPYHRFAFAGGVDHVAENASMRWSSVPMVKNYQRILAFIRDAHMRMYNETPPNDGHRKNILNLWHTHVGLGFSLIEKNFRYYELYVDRYLEFDRIDRRVKAGESATISGKIASPGFGAYMVVVFYEPFPQRMTPMEIQSRTSYPDFTNDRAAIIPFSTAPELNRDGKFTFSFKTGRKGLYYVHIFLKKGNPDSWSRRRMSSRGLPAVSGIVVRVE